MPMSSRRGASVPSKYSRMCDSTSASSVVAGKTSTKRKSWVLTEGCDMGQPSMRSLPPDKWYTRAGAAEPRAAIRGEIRVTSAASGAATEANRTGRAECGGAHHDRPGLHPGLHPRGSGGGAAAARARLARDPPHLV